MSVIEELSKPVIRFTDTTGATDVYREYRFPRPFAFNVTPTVDKTFNRSGSGITETLVFHKMDFIEIVWEFLGVGTVIPSLGQDAQFTNLLRIWDSCYDGTPFEFQRHESVTSAGYPPTADYKIHRNVWTVRFAGDVTKFPIEEDKQVKDRYTLPFRMEEVLT